MDIQIKSALWKFNWLPSQFPKEKSQFPSICKHISTFLYSIHVCVWLLIWTSCDISPAVINNELKTYIHIYLLLVTYIHLYWYWFLAWFENYHSDSSEKSLQIKLNPQLSRCASFSVGTNIKWQFLAILIKHGPSTLKESPKASLQSLSKSPSLVLLLWVWFSTSL